MSIQPGFQQDALPYDKHTTALETRRSFWFFSLAAFGFLLLLLVSTLTGCGSGGYAGGGITSVSASAVTIDSGQSFAVSSTASAGCAGKLDARLRHQRVRLSLAKHRPLDDLPLPIRTLRAAQSYADGCGPPARRAARR